MRSTNSVRAAVIGFIIWVILSACQKRIHKNVLIVAKPSVQTVLQLPTGIITENSGINQMKKTI